jgi:hypothetical protein
MEKEAAAFHIVAESLGKITGVHQEESHEDQLAEMCEPDQTPQAIAMFRIGISLRDGHDGVRDEGNAIQWFVKASTGDSPFSLAMIEVGNCFPPWQGSGGGYRSSEYLVLESSG